MQITDAFISPLPLGATLTSSFESRQQLTQAIRTARKYSHAARRRLRASTATPDPDSSQQESESQDTNVPDVDYEVSDLVMPNLKELFAGAGREGCEQCKGSGEIACPVCNAKGFISMTMMDTTSSTQCRMCRGGRVIPCPSCREVVYKSVLWWDQIPSKEEDPDEKWREDPDGNPRISWSEPPAGS